MNSPYFSIRGVVEGFYGTYYTAPQRSDLIRFLGENGFNFYLYGPKNDRQHRLRWREPYPPDTLAALGQTIGIARECGVEFCYAISFGVPLKQVSQSEFGHITAKFRAFFELGCRSFAVFLDDLPGDFSLQYEGTDFESRADLDADCCNRLYAWARSLDAACSLLVCPTQYHGRPPFSAYLHELGDALEPGIEVLYTGPEICSQQITARDAAAFAEAAGRYPIIWDNYPVNDGGMRLDLHIGPLRGRSADLHRVTRGFLSNPMNQAEASKIPLLTVAEYLHNPYEYNLGAAWDRALRRIGGEESHGALRAFGETSLRSCLQRDEAPVMAHLIEVALTALRCSESVSTSSAVADLLAYVDLLDDSIDTLRNRMPNLVLRQDLLPWIEALEDKLWMCRSALRVLKAIEKGVDPRPALRAMGQLVVDVHRSGKRIGGTELFALVEHAHSCALEAGLGSVSPAQAGSHPGNVSVLPEHTAANLTAEEA